MFHPTTYQPLRPYAENTTLTVRQQPLLGCHSPNKALKTRLPIDPPPIVQLQVRDSDPYHHYMLSPYLFMCVALWHPTENAPVAQLAPEQAGSVEDPDGPDKDDGNPIFGTISSSITRLKDFDGSFGAFFIFPDICTAALGPCRLRFCLFDLKVNTSEVQLLGEVISGIFNVVDPADYVSVDATPLCRLFIDQGVKFPARRRSRKPKPRQSSATLSTPVSAVPTPNSPSLSILSNQAGSISNFPSYQPSAQPYEEPAGAAAGHVYDHPDRTKRHKQWDPREQSSSASASAIPPALVGDHRPDALRWSSDFGPDPAASRKMSEIELESKLDVGYGNPSTASGSNPQIQQMQPQAQQPRTRPHSHYQQPHPQTLPPLYHHPQIPYPYPAPQQQQQQQHQQHQQHQQTQTQTHHLQHQHPTLPPIQTHIPPQQPQFRWDSSSDRSALEVQSHAASARSSVYPYDHPFHPAPGPAQAQSGDSLSTGHTYLTRDSSDGAGAGTGGSSAPHTAGSRSSFVFE